MGELNISGKCEGTQRQSGRRNSGALEGQRTHVAGAQWARGLVVQEVTYFPWFLSEIFLCKQNFM